MNFSPEPGHEHIPLDGLPLAAACLDTRGVILASNRRFRRLLKSAELGREPLQLADVVRESGRPALQRAISELNISGDKAPVTCRLRVEHRRAPFLPLSITLSEFEHDASVRLLACIEAISSRNRTDRRSLPAVLSAQSRSLTAKLSRELRWPLAAIRRWAALPEAEAVEVYALTDGKESAPTFIVRFPQPVRGDRANSTTARDAVIEGTIIVTGTA